MPKKPSATGEEIVRELVDLETTLLNAHWGEIDQMRAGQDGRIQLTVSHRIDYEGKERTLKTTLAFGKRVSDSRETVLDPDQSKLNLGDKGGDE